MTAVETSPEVTSFVALGLTIARSVLSALFVLALPLLIIGTNLRSLVDDRAFMLEQFRANRVDVTTGLDQRQLEQVADAFVRYLSDAPLGRMDVQVTLDGQTRPLLNERELLHMEDVQALIRTFFRLQIIAAVLVALRVLFALVVERSGRDLGRDMLISTGFIVALVVVVAGLSFVDFSALWTQFHHIAFRNDLWLLDPRTDYLIMLYPEPAWYAYTLRMAVGVGGMTLLAAVAGFLAWRYAP